MKALTMGLCALIAAVALPTAALADNHHRSNDSRGGGRDFRGGHNDRGDYRGRYDHGRFNRGSRFYYSRGYYGPYYGYYPRTYLSFYSTPAYSYDDRRDTVYYGNPAYYSRSMSSDVQRELKRRGFYHGSVDGVIGPASRAAIRAYQVDRGFRVTSTIDSRLLDSLGLD